MAQAATRTRIESKPDESAYAAAWQAIRSAHLTVVDRIGSELSAAGLPDLSWYDVLAKLNSTASPLRPKDLLCQVSVTKSGLTRLLDRIEKAGLIERSHCPSDRRGTFLTITRAGRSTLAEMKPIRDRVFGEHIVDTLSEAEAEALSELLGRVSASAVSELEAQNSCELG